MRIYATITSERPSRAVTKGGDKEIVINLTRGNVLKCGIRFTGDSVDVEAHNNTTIKIIPDYRDRDKD